MAETVTNRGKTRIANGDTPQDTGDLRMCAFTGTQVGANDPDLNTVADLDAVTGISIHTERLTLASKTVTENDTNDRADVDCANLSFATAPGVTFQGVAIYDEGGGTDATRHLQQIHTTGFPVPADGGVNLTVNDHLRLS